MANIGTFEQSETGFRGQISTLSVNAKVELKPVDSSNDKAPAFRLYAGKAELGAAWAKTSKEGRTYYQVTIAAPELPRTIYANLVETKDGMWDLIWSAPKPKAE